MRSLCAFEQKLAAEGFKPWGLVLSNPCNAPAGSKLYQYKKGRRVAYCVLAPNGNFVRGNAA